MDMDKKQQLGAIVEHELTRSEGRDYDELQVNRETAMAYYKGELPGPDLDAEGNVSARSQVVSRDVADMVGSISATMRDMLILDAELVVEPEGEGDEQAAQAEADICTDVLMKDQPGEVILMEAVLTALLMRNCCAKVVMDEGRVRVLSVPIENVSYTPNWPGRFQELPFFAERLTYTRSQLVEMGIERDVAYALPSTSNIETATSRRRNTVADVANRGETRDQDEIDCHAVFVLADLDDDGIAERYQCLVADRNTCLEYEQVDHIPYALGTAMKQAYRLTGESVYDRIGSIQDRNTALLRQWHDNIAIINNGRYIYAPHAATEHDIMNPVAGGGIRARDPAAVVPLMIPDVSSGILAALQYNKQLRTEALGGSLDMLSAEAQVMHQSATAASIEKGAQELVSSKIAADLAQTFVAPLYRLIHMYLARYSEDTYLTRIAGQAIEVDPTQWGPRRRMLMRCGMPPGVKAQQVQAYAMHMQNQAQAMMSGLDGVLASEQTLYRTAMRWLKATGVKDPESLAVDPSSPGAQQARQQKQQMQEQQAAAQQAQMQGIMQIEQTKIQEDARQHDADIRFKYAELEQKTDTEEAKIAAQGTIDLEKQRLANGAAASGGQANDNTGPAGAAS